MDPLSFRPPSRPGRDAAGRPIVAKRPGQGLGGEVVAATVKGKRLRELGLRLGLTTLGGICYGLGIVMNVQANVGQGPWVAFHYGLTLHTPLTLGQANLAFGVVMAAIAYGLGVGPGVGTLLSVVVVGWMTDAFLGIVPTMRGELDGYALLLGGVLVMGLGTALLVKARLGTGPRDSFMLALIARTGLRPGVVKSGIELAALLLGALMGAPIWLGTIVYALSIGPAVDLWFRVFGLSDRPRQSTTSAEKGAVR